VRPDVHPHDPRVVYLAFILDVYSRLIVGWQLASHMRTELVTDALEMAHALRAPTPGSLVAHTDRGSQYTSISYSSVRDHHRRVRRAQRA
jgi:transposase InsO family protein